MAADVGLDGITRAVFLEATAAAYTFAYNYPRPSKNKGPQSHCLAKSIHSPHPCLICLGSPYCKLYALPGSLIGDPWISGFTLHWNKKRGSDVSDEALNLRHMSQVVYFGLVSVAMSS